MPGARPSGFVPVTSTPAWARQTKWLDAFAGPIPAALSAAMSAGLDTEPCAEGGRNLGFIADGATTALRGVDFGAGAAALTLRVATPNAGAAVTLLVDGAPVAARCALPATGGWQAYVNVTCALSPPPAGVAKNVTFLFNGPAGAGLVNVRSFSFARAGAPAPPAPPPAAVAVRVALRAAATQRYVAAGPAGAVAPNGTRGDAGAAWVLHDLEDGTWALEAAGGGFFCAPAGGAAAHVGAAAAPAGAPCTRLWLYGTTAGSHALLSAASGRFVAATAADAPLAATAVEPRLAPLDGARFWIEEL